MPCSASKWLCVSCYFLLIPEFILKGEIILPSPDPAGSWGEKWALCDQNFCGILLGKEKIFAAAAETLTCPFSRAPGPRLPRTQGLSVGKKHDKVQTRFTSKCQTSLITSLSNFAFCQLAASPGPGGWWQSRVAAGTGPRQGWHMELQCPVPWETCTSQARNPAPCSP